MDKYAQDAQGNFALDNAIDNQCVTVVELLLMGGCMPYFSRKQKDQESTLPPNFLQNGLNNNQALQRVIVKALARHRHLLRAVKPYHDLAGNFVDCRSIAEKLLAAGFGKINEYDEHGMTPLMLACCKGNANMAAFLLERGADSSRSHRDALLRAGHFCFWDGGSMWSHFDYGHIKDGELNLQEQTKLLGPAYDIAPLVGSRCRCSPEGYSPGTSAFQADLGEHFCVRRRTFEKLLSVLKLCDFDLRQQARSFVRMEIFDRLELTHTCIRKFPDVRPFHEHDRLEIEEEEQELYAQLDAFMSDFDKWQENFDGDVMNCVDCFFDNLDQHLRPRIILTFASMDSYDHDILGSGTRITNFWVNSKGQLQRSHREGYRESYMLQSLYR